MFRSFTCNAHQSADSPEGGKSYKDVCKQAQPFLHITSFTELFLPNRVTPSIPFWLVLWGTFSSSRPSIPIRGPWISRKLLRFSRTTNYTFLSIASFPSVVELNKAHFNSPQIYGLCYLHWYNIYGIGNHQQQYVFARWTQINVYHFESERACFVACHRPSPCALLRIARMHLLDYRV